MLVTFTCKAYADITMFGDVAKRLLKMMGQSGTVPSAIMAEDVPAALDRLTRAIESEKVVPTPDRPMNAQDDEANQQAVSLKTRALPLIELLTAAVKEDCNVMWK
ncbi:hypothetical protein ANAEL_01460 [Anaerolineales bacterium]|nr:hypothetical protein ANAEL_01460 [Anaerolineales bacterium]